MNKQNPTIIAVTLGLMVMPVALGQTPPVHSPEESKKLCAFYQQVATTSMDTEGLQVGVLIDHGVNKDKKRVWKQTAIDAAKHPQLTIYEMLQRYPKELDAKVCELDLGSALCAMDGRPKKTAEYDCDKEYCFDPNYWAVFVMRGTWQLPWDKGIKDFLLKDGDLVGFTYLDKNNYPVSKEDAAKFPFPYLSQSDCAKIETPKAK